MVGDDRGVVLARVVGEIRATQADQRRDPLGAAVRVARILVAANLPDWEITVRDVAEAGAGLSKSTLGNYLAVGRQFDFLGEEIARKLSLSQHIVLSRVPDREARETLAVRCAGEGWSTAELRRRITEAKRDGRRPFVRPRLRVFARRASAEADSLLSDTRRVRDSLAKYPEDEKREVAEHLRALIRRLRPVVADLDAADERRTHVLDRAERARRGELDQATSSD